jgi:hypothetical protein
MWFSSWLRNRTPTRASRGRAQCRSAAPRFRPQLEVLEGRWVPSTLTVTNNLDSGAGSLRAEIAAANSGDTIQFAPSLSGQTIQLSGSELVINKNLTIQGPSAPNAPVTIQGRSVSRLFEVDGARTTVALSNLNLTGGDGQNYNEQQRTGEGGAVWNEGRLTLTNCDLNNNTTLDYGGAIYNAGTLTVQSCILDNNSAGAPDSFNGYTNNGEGGAIYNAGTLTVSNSTLDNNVDNGFYGVGTGGGRGAGGAIANEYGASATITNTTLSGNSVVGGGLGDAVVGGGIYNGGKMTLSGCTVSGNTAGFVDLGVIYDGEGGGIFNDGAGSLIIQSSTVRGNRDAYGADIWNLGHLKISSDSVVGGVHS